VSDYDAWDVLEIIILEMDLVFNASAYPWRLRISPDSYKLLKDFDASVRPEWRDELFYLRDGREYIRAVDNENIPLILHYRVIVDGSLAGAENFGTVVELDDEVEPAVLERKKRDWDAFSITLRWHSTDLGETATQ
jgi:hypothetical protein